MTQDTHACTHTYIFKIHTFFDYIIHVILIGDMNAYITWGNPDTNSKEINWRNEYQNMIYEKMVATYIHPATGTFSAIDMSICSPSLF